MKFLLKLTDFCLIKPLAKVWNRCKCVKMFWYTWDYFISLCSYKILSIRQHLLPFYVVFTYFGVFYTIFRGLWCQWWTKKKLKFYKWAFTIRFLVQINIPTQYLKNLTAFLAILCVFDIFWDTLQPFVGVCDVISGSKKLEF